MTFVPLLIAFECASAGTPMQSLAGGEVFGVQIEASAERPKLVLVEQHGIDLLVDCRSGAIANAPTGRLGFEAVLLERNASCEIRPKMAKAVRGNFRVSVVDPSTGVMGANLTDWRLYASLLLLDDQILSSRAGALLGFDQLLRTTGVDWRFQLQIEMATASLQRRIRNPAAAQARFQAARLIAIEHQRHDWLALIELGAGLTSIDQRDFESAEAAFERARKAAQLSGSRYDSAAAENNSCLVLQHLSKLREAGSCYQRAAEAYRSAGEMEQRATPLFNWASVANQLGEPSSAIDALTEAREIREQGPYDRSLGNIYLQLALVHSRIADWEQALRFSMRAVETFDRLAEPGDQSRAYRMRAGALRSLGADERARHYAKKAVELARRQSDGRYLGAALAESALLEPASDKALGLQEEAVQAFRNAGEAGLVDRQEAAIARLLFESGRIEEAHARWAALKAMRADSRLSVQAQYLLLGAELHVARGNPLAARPLAEDAAQKFQQIRNLNDEIEARLVLADLESNAGALKRARMQLDAALELHLRRNANLPSPAQLMAGERQAKRLKDRLIEWHLQSSEAPNPNLWIADLGKVERIPEWTPAPRYADRWRRYMFNLSKLQDDSLSIEAVGELIKTVESDESQLELSFERNISGSAATADDVLASLPTGSAFFAVMRGHDKAQALWLTQARGEFLEWNANDILPVHPAGADELKPDGVIYAWGDPELVTLDLARQLFPERDPAILPTVVNIVGDLSPATSFVPTDLPAQYTVSGLALSSQVKGGLSGAKREVKWLREHYGARFIEIRDPVHAPMTFPPADVLHIAAHGWTVPSRELASGLMAELPSATDSSSKALSAADFKLAGHPSLIVLNACETAGTQQGRSHWSIARDLARQFNTAVIAPNDFVDDREALAFSLTLHQTLRTGALIPSFTMAARLWRGASPNGADLPWRILINADKSDPITKMTARSRGSVAVVAEK